MKHSLTLFVFFGATSFIAAKPFSAQANEFPPSEDFAPTESSEISSADKEKSERNLTEVGGRLRLEATTLFSEKQKFENAITKQGSGAEIYLDARGDSGGRAFLRARLVQEAQATTPSFFVDEAKVQLQPAHSLFLTAGRQKVKFGTAKFFNPTDFLNQDLRDVFALDDRRPGVDALKIHLPGEGYNVYGIALSPQTQKIGNTGGYLRSEFAFSGGEVSLSGFEVKGKHSRLGADASVAVGDFDIFAEAAWNGKSRVSTGFTYELSINDTDTVSFVFEHHFNEYGLTQKNAYLSALQAQSHRPLELAKHYAATSLYFAKPKALPQFTFLASTVLNLSDSSFLVVPQMFYEITKDAQATVSTQIPHGIAGSEFKLARTRAQTTLAIEAVF
jgi:hypothetical protein